MIAETPSKIVSNSRTHDLEAESGRGYSETEGLMYPLSVILFAAIDTKAISIDELRAWADRQILASDAPPPEWLSSLSLATTLDASVEALRNDRRFALPSNVANLLIGITYLRFRRGEISPERLAASVEEILDAYDASLMSVETWNAQVREAVIPPSVQRILGDLSASAEADLARLTNVRLTAHDAFWST